MSESPNKGSASSSESCAQAEEAEPEHTPGPWLLATSNSYRRFVNERMSPVVTPTTHSADGHPDLIVDEADANLIAAAPELFEAMQALLDELKPLSMVANSDQRSALMKAHTAMRKARGEE